MIIPTNSLYRKNIVLFEASLQSLLFHHVLFFISKILVQYLSNTLLWYIHSLCNHSLFNSRVVLHHLLNLRVLIYKGCSFWPSRIATFWFNCPKFNDFITSACPFLNFHQNTYIDSLKWELLIPNLPINVILVSTDQRIFY